MNVLPLTGSALEIQRRLQAGQDPRHIVHVGWFKKAWTLGDVLAVAEHMRHQRARRSDPELEPSVVREQCGTPAGESAHKRHHEQICEACRVARNEYQNERRQKDRAAKHGERSTYGRGCRCESCKQAESAYKEQRRRVRAS